MAITSNGPGHQVGQQVKQFNSAPDSTHAEQSWLCRMFYFASMI